MVTPKEFRNAVVKDGVVQSAAGLVLDCGDGVEHVVATLIVKQSQESLDEDGNTITEMVDVILPISSLIDNVDLFSEGVKRYAHDYLAGKETEQSLQGVTLDPSKEVNALLGKSMEV
jgi:hypothetical protein